MKILSVIAGMLIFFASTISPTSLNGRFVVVSSDNSKLAVQLQINTNTGTDDLGGATLVIGFDKTVLNFSSNPANQTDYIFHNFSGGNYGTAKVTRPLSDKLWINIDLPYTNNNKGLIVSGANGWTNVVTLYFNIVAPKDTIILNWLNSSSFWGVYDGDNKTLWTSNLLTNLKIIPVVDITAPDITGLTVTNSKSLTVKFSEKLDPVTANDKNNYKISNNVLISQVQLQPDSLSVVLKTSQQQSNVDYSLTVSGIKDLNSNLISPNPRTVSYKISSKSRGTKVQNTVTLAKATTWEQNYSPDKTIDGLGMNSPDSRWQSAKMMPDTITYDFGENVSLDSLRISFYKGESGRLYKYSIYSSNDLNNWNSIIDDVWSDDSEWTAVEFDSTRGRYIKLVFKDCNQGKKASIWEFESFGTSIKKNSENLSNKQLSFELSQNYPNPFNPSTKISYTIPNVGTGLQPVRLVIYDILGNEVSTLVDEQKAPGSYEVEFKADNLSSGVYIYRIQTAEFNETKKMILLR